MTTSSQELLHDLSPRLHEAMRTGTTVDFSEGLGDDDLRRLILADDESVPVVEASVLRSAILDGAAASDPNGLHVRGLRVQGMLDLEFVEVDMPMRFTYVRLEDGVQMSSFRGRNVQFIDCAIGSVYLNDAHVQHEFMLDNCQVDGVIRSSNARFDSIFVTRTDINSEINGCAADFSLVDVSGDFLLTRLRAPKGTLTAIGADVRGSFTLTKGRIAGCGEERCTSANCEALCLDSIDVGGVLSLRGTHCNGKILARGARIGGQLALAETVMEHRGQSGMIDLDGIVVENTTFLTGTVAEGISATGSQHGSVYLRGARLGAADSVSLNLDQAVIKEKIRMDDTSLTGWLMLRGARIHGAHSVESPTDAGTLESRIGAIDLSGAQIDGSFRVVARIREGIIARRTTISGAFDLRAFTQIGVFSSPVDGDPGTSLMAKGATLEHVQLATQPTSPVTDQRITGLLNFSAATLGHLELPSDAPGEGRILPAIGSTTSWNVVTATGYLTRDWRYAYDWLNPHARAAKPGFRAALHRTAAAWSNRGVYSSDIEIQPWLTVATLYDNTGREADGRTLRYRATDLLFQHRPNRYSRNIWRVITKYTIGHGFRSHRALVWLATLWLLATMLVIVNPLAFTPAAVDVPYPALIAPLYAVDIVLSPVGTGQSDAWIASQDTALIVLLTGIKLTSWAMLGMFVTGISGLLTRR